ncbi:carbohydrate-binding domain-containing protein [Falsiroseomonas sp.]|uniref:carbohydrate-binding domain-containing protein n=1 Tax=Falsiroseomonas sp. TaxID=2870721 RepID=UPI0035639BE1
MRELVQWDDDPARLRALAEAAGVKLNLFIGADTTLASQIEKIEGLADLVSAVEGPNEVRWWGVRHEGLTGAAAARELQRDLYQAVKASPLLHDKPVIQLSTGEADYYAELGDLTTWADYANPHTYFPSGAPAPGSDAWGGLPHVLHRVVEAQQITQGKPAIATEAGYSSAPLHPQGVSPEVQAKYNQRLLLESWETAGVKRTFLYELFDQGPDPSGSSYELNFGQFFADGRPKPAAEALHNLTTLLRDDGPAAATFTPVALDYRLLGLPETGEDMLLQRSDGAYLLVLWNDAQSWDDAANRMSDVPAVPVTIDLSRTFGTVRVYDTLVGTTAAKTYTGIEDFTVLVPDHAIVIELSGTAVPEAGRTPAAITLGDGGDELVLRVTQDAWQGDAQYTIAVNGVQIGGTLTAAALRGSGVSDSVTVRGDWGPGAHEATITFLNDRWGGTPDTDRNLYVEGISYNAAVVEGGEFGLWSNGKVSTGFMSGPAREPAVITLGDGGDALVLRVTQDAWQGDAQYTIAVNGVQIGGTLTAAALRGSGVSDSVTVRGHWGPGAHEATITFLNDRWGGTPDTDRNLYVEGVSYNTAVVEGGEFALWSNGRVSISTAQAGIDLL